MKILRLKLTITGLFVFIFCSSQNLVIPSSSIFNKMKERDSLVFYQCHVEVATSNVVTASGQTLSGQATNSTITEKYVIRKNGNKYDYTYYTSSLTVFPNKKFSGLKIRERPYWNFKAAGGGELSERDLKLILGLERSGRDAIEYDFPVSRYNTNQIILKYKKDFRQLVLDNAHVLSRLLKQPA